MKVSTDAPKRPLLRYYGAKFNLAPWIISFFPEHKSYVEPCGGAASVLLQKPRSYMETYNDLDGEIVNFFRVLRDNPDDLIRKIELTPWSRMEFQDSLKPCSDAVEQARRTFVHIMMSIPGALSATQGQWRHWAKFIGSPLSLYTETIEWAKERFKGVQIECMPYDRVISDYDTPDTLFYFDPPYVSDTRTVDSVYAYEWTDEQHAEASEIIRKCDGYAVVSGYQCSLYSELYESHGWKRKDINAQTTGESRVESVWLSPRTVEALKLPVQAILL